MSSASREALCARCLSEREICLSDDTRTRAGRGKCVGASVRGWRARRGRPPIPRVPAAATSKRGVRRRGRLLFLGSNHASAATAQGAKVLRRLKRIDLLL